MELLPKQQALKVIQESQNILLLTHLNPDGDAVGSLLAMKLILERLGKKVTLVAPGTIEHSFQFLPGIDQIKNTLEIKKESKIIINEKVSRTESIAWRRVEPDKIELLISGLAIGPEDILIQKKTDQFDLVIIIDTASIDRLDKIWQNNTDLFYERPTINIDHHTSNTQFAKINLVDVTAAASAEILVSIFEALGKSSDIITKEVATCLLTGLISDTGCFMNTNTTPKALTVAAQLVAAGANHSEIIRRLFHSNTLPTLRIWGRALAYIKEDQEHRFIWTALSRADFVAAGADDSNANTSGVMNSLLRTAEGFDFVLLLKEKAEGVFGSLRSIKQTTDVLPIAHLFSGGGHSQAAGFQIKDKKLADVEMEIINTIRQYCHNKRPIDQEQINKSLSQNGS